MTETTITLNVLRDNKSFKVIIHKDYENNRFYIRNDDDIPLSEGFTSVVKALEWAADVMLATDIQPII